MWSNVFKKNPSVMLIHVLSETIHLVKLTEILFPVYSPELPVNGSSSRSILNGASGVYMESEIGTLYVHIKIMICDDFSSQNFFANKDSHRI